MDQIATLQLEELDRHHPDSPSLRRPSGLPPTSIGTSALFTEKGPEIDGLGLNVASPAQASVTTESMESQGQVPEPRSIDLQRKISTGHREFEEKALAVGTPSR